MIKPFVHLSSFRNELRVITHLDRYIKIIWIAAGLLMALMSFLSFKVDAYPAPFIPGVTAMATVVSGLMIRFRPLIFGSLIFLIAAIVSIFLSGAQQLLVFPVAMLLSGVLIMVRIYKDLDPVLHSQLRLAVISILAHVEKAEFAFLKKETGASSGNLIVQITKLKEAGYIEVQKKFKGKDRQKLPCLGNESENNFIFRA